MFTVNKMKFMPKYIASPLIKTGLIDYYTDYFKYSAKSLTQVLEEIAPHNPKLRATLAYNFGNIYIYISQRCTFLRCTLFW